MPSPAKLQRWTDLLAALLVRRHPATFVDLQKDVPAYGFPKSAPKQLRDAKRRTFERDKDELRAFGIPIETTFDAEGAASGYTLRSDTFYLPYLTLQQSGTTRPPRRVDAYGYHGLKVLAFEPDELAAVRAAAARVLKLGAPHMAAEVKSAMRKLAFDLPEAAGAADPNEMILTTDKLDEDTFEVLNQALLARKRFSFTYRSLSIEGPATRTVEPLGVFFLSSHWYLAAREPQAGAIDADVLTEMLRGLLAEGDPTEN